MNVEMQVEDTEVPLNEQDFLPDALNAAEEGEESEEGEELEGEVEESDDEESESSTDTGEDEGDGQEVDAKGQQKVTFSPEQQELVNRLLGKKTFQQREAERRASSLEAELEAIRSQQPKPARPTIPPLPEPFDDNYAELMERRDAAIQAASIYDAQQAILQQQEEYRQQQLQQEQIEQVKKVVQAYDATAAKLGVNPEALKAAGMAIQAHGIHPEVAGYILGDDAGPLMTLYLARNPSVLERIAGMSPTQAAVHLATAVKPRLKTARPVNRIPKPARVLGGGGAPPRQRGPVGARYE